MYMSAVYIIVCKFEECEWLMKAFATTNSEMFQIRTFNMEHMCLLEDHVHSQRQATSNLIGRVVRPRLKNHKWKYIVSEIKNDVKQDLGVDITYTLAWREKEKALNSLIGTPSRSYNMSLAYLYMLESMYPGSHIRLKRTEEGEFLYVFISLYAFIRGFNHYRPMIVVDGSHLKGPYNGQLLCAFFNLKKIALLYVQDTYFH